MKSAPLTLHGSILCLAVCLGLAAVGDAFDKWGSLRHGFCFTGGSWEDRIGSATVSQIGGTSPVFTGTGLTFDGAVDDALEFQTITGPGDWSIHMRFRLDGFQNWGGFFGLGGFKTYTLQHTGGTLAIYNTGRSDCSGGMLTGFSGMDWQALNAMTLDFVVDTAGDPSNLHTYKDGVLYCSFATSQFSGTASSFLGRPTSSGGEYTQNFEITHLLAFDVKLSDSDISDLKDVTDPCFHMTTTTSTVITTTTQTGTVTLTSMTATTSMSSLTATFTTMTTSETMSTVTATLTSMTATTSMSSLTATFISMTTSETMSPR
eukprot:TRINITY_DN8076_c0_g1_i1.p1 TRINITY_DN8076_c0_g1~~TRINITY_DN8076_c0_g1_i1.p1  ORF type:complete len:318 (+),score=22.33 TRINITY_DN8076_c0_g1_i1:171-1124(+)